MQKQQGRNNGSAAIPAVNYHLWGRCNMRCKFCFARFEQVIADDKEVQREKGLTVIEEAAHGGIEKISFAGGEPLLCSWLPAALRHSKNLGMTTMVVSNGSLITDRWLEENARHIDWIALSIDSPNPTTNAASGRAVSGVRPLDAKDYVSLSARIRYHGIRLKVNATVSRFNVEENPSSLFLEVRPERLKIFQVLPISGHNDHCFEELRVSHEQFSAFVGRLDSLREFCQVVTEDNEAMTGSYLMIDPLGRFFSNNGRRYRYSRPIWQIGWAAALAEVETSAERFHRRGGLYDW